MCKNENISDKQSGLLQEQTIPGRGKRKKGRRMQKKKEETMIV